MPEPKPLNDPDSDGLETIAPKPASSPHDPLATMPLPGAQESTRTLDHVGVVSNTTLRAPNESTSSIRYEVVREHAKGGLGQVSVAVDRELQREVALKEIRPCYADDPVAQARFVREAEITGRLEHPGIVPVYGFGMNASGQPFYAMRFIEGKSLKEAIDEYFASPDEDRRGSLRFRELLRRFINVCNTIHYAHHHGVLHRDLKPHNIMVGQYGETLVVDWGLAKKQDEVESDPVARSRQGSAPSGETATLDGSALGTPQYMSPEQAAGDWQSVGPRSDVYSLGATLYHLLTGTNPFPEQSVSRVLTHVQQGEFRSPRTVRPSIAPALESVCMKAMARHSEERYATCQELAQELERWLADEPVHAHGETWMERWYRLGRRHRAWVMGVATMMPILFCVLGAAALFVNTERLEAVKQRDLAVKASEQESIQRKAAEASDAKAREQEQEAKRAAREAGSTLANLLLLNGDRAASDHDLGLATLWYHQALPVIEKFQPERIMSHRIRLGMHLRQLPRPVEFRMLPDSTRRFGVVNTFSPDGTLLVTRGAGPLLAALNVLTGEAPWEPLAHDALVEVAKFSDDGLRLVTICGKNKASVWNAKTGQLVRPVITTQGELLLSRGSTDKSVVISHDHQWVAVATRIDQEYAVETFRVTEENPTKEPIRFASEIVAMQFHDDDQRLMVATQDSVAWIDRMTGTLEEQRLDVSELWHAHCSPDGKLLAVASSAGFAQLYQTDSLKPLHERLLHRGPVTFVGFTPDSKTVLSLSADRSARLWDTETGKPRGEAMEHAERPWIARFNHEGTSLITIGLDHSVSTWDVQSGRSLAAPWRNPSTSDAAFIGERVAVTSQSHCVLWDLTHSKQVYEKSYRAPETTGRLTAAGFLPDDRLFIASDRQVRILSEDLDEAKAKAVILESATPITLRDFSLDGKVIATCNEMGEVHVTDTTTGQPLAKPFPSQTTPVLMRLQPQSTNVVLADAKGLLTVFDYVTSEIKPIKLEHGGPVKDCDFSEDGRWLVTGGDERLIRLWDLATGKLYGEAQPIAGSESGLPIASIHFNRAANAIVAGTELGLVVVWQPFLKDASLKSFRLDGAVSTVRFSKDDRWIAAAGYTKTVRIWEWQKDGDPVGLDAGFFSIFAAMSPNSNVIATAGLGKVCLFDVPTGRLLSPSLQNRSLAIDFSHDQHYLVTVDGDVRLWDVTADMRSASELESLVQATTMRRIDDRGEVRYLSSSELAKKVSGTVLDK